MSEEDHPIITINKTHYSHQAIEEGSWDIDRLETFEKSTLHFCHQWITGVNEFTIYTSGSTGKPKPITITRSQMQTSALYTAKALALQKGDTALVCLNTAYIAGKMMLVRGLETGMNIIATTPSSNPFQGTQGSKNIDFVALVPFQLQTAIDNGIATIEKINTLKAIIVGGAPVSHQLEKSIQKHIKTPVYCTYGMTETVSHIALKRINGDAPENYYKTFEGVEIGRDHRGCLTIQSALTKNELLITNDLVKIISPHQFEWIGRVDNIINTGGIKVQIEGVEKEVGMLFNDMYLNNRFFITATKDVKLGELVTLVIEGQPFDENRHYEVLSELRHRLNKYESPKKILYAEQFSETETGKVKRKETMVSALT